MTIAIRYRRVSGIGQEDNSSLEKQLERMDEYCAIHEYETATETLYTEVMTGIDTWRERPELQKLLAKVEQLVKDGYQVVVVVDHPDRFARGLDLVLLVELISYYGARVEFVQTKFEDTDEGALVLHLESYSSKKEWSRIKKRTADGRRDHVLKNHKMLGVSTPLYGYAFNNPERKMRTHYVYNDTVFYTAPDGTEWTERKVVERIFQMAKDGMTLRKIAEILTKEGIPTRQRKGNNFWRGTTIGKILANPAYMGKFYAFRQTYHRQGKKLLTKDKPIEEQTLMPEGTCPPIVDEETFLIVQRQLTYNKEKAARNNKHRQDALLRAGYAKCGHCLSNMNVGRNKNGSMVFYQCIKANNRFGECPGSNTMSAVLLDPQVWKDISAVIRDPKKIKEKIEALRTPDPTAPQGVPLSERKKAIEDEISEYVDLLHTAKKESTKKNARSWISHLEDRLEEIDQQEKILEGIRSNWQEAQDEIMRFEHWCAIWRDKLDKADYEDKRTCLRHLGITVRVFRYGVRPRYKIDFSPPSIMEKLSFVSPRS